jgi:hypothetical protein
VDRRRVNGTRLRWIAAYVVELLDEDALPVWREMTAVPGIGPHAKYSLYTMEAGPEPNDGEWLLHVSGRSATSQGFRPPHYKLKDRTRQCRLCRDRLGLCGERIKRLPHCVIGRVQRGGV